MNKDFVVLKTNQKMENVDDVIRIIKNTPLANWIITPLPGRDLIIKMIKEFQQENPTNINYETILSICHRDFNIVEEALETIGFDNQSMEGINVNQATISQLFFEFETTIVSLDFIWPHIHQEFILYFNPYDKWYCHQMIKVLLMNVYHRENITKDYLLDVNIFEQPLESFQFVEARYRYLCYCLIQIDPESPWPYFFKCILDFSLDPDRIPNFLQSVATRYNFEFRLAVYSTDWASMCLMYAGHHNIDINHVGHITRLIRGEQEEEEIPAELLGGAGQPLPTEQTPEEQERRRLARDQLQNVHTINLSETAQEWIEKNNELVKQILDCYTESMVSRYVTSLRYTQTDLKQRLLECRAHEKEPVTQEDIQDVEDPVLASDDHIYSAATLSHPSFEGYSLFTRQSLDEMLNIDLKAESRDDDLEAMMEINSRLIKNIHQCYSSLDLITDIEQLQARHQELQQALLKCRQ